MFVTIKAMCFFQSTWMTLKTLAEDSAVSGEENDSFKWSFLEVLYFTPQFKLHLSSLSLLLTQFDLLTSSRSDRRPFDQCD